MLRELDLMPTGWPGALDGLRVALLSDFHAGLGHMTRARVEAIVEEAAAQRADLVLLLGDFLDSTPLGRGRVAPSEVARPLGRLEAPLGVWAVMGNHDWRAAGRAMAQALEREGIRVLENEAAEAAGGGRSLWVAGLADVRQRRPDIPAALAAVPDGAPALLMTHNPDAFPYVPDRLALTVAGHTHGGQLDVPVLRYYAIPSSHGDRYAAGHVVEHGRHLYVTTGLGTAGLPLRFRRPPEIVVLTLSASGRI